MNETSNKTILIIEDEQFLIKAYKMQLEDAGYIVDIAQDGEQGLQKLNEGLRPIIILMDLMLPKMGGFEVLENIKKNPELVKIPVIILSNLGQEQDRAKGIALGAVDYVIKSDVTLEEMVEKIKKFTGQ